MDIKITIKNAGAYEYKMLWKVMQLHFERVGKEMPPETKELELDFDKMPREAFADLVASAITSYLQTRLPAGTLNAVMKGTSDKQSETDALGVMMNELGIKKK